MTTVFSSIALPRSGKLWLTNRSAANEPSGSKTRAPQSPSHLAVDQLELMHGQSVNQALSAELLELNSALQILSDVFPDVQLEVFREMLMTFDNESRLEVITEALLRHKTKYVRGRWFVRKKVDEAPLHAKNHAKRSSGIPLEETFRNQDYKDAVKAALYQEFKGLSHSTIKAVLAECNFSYSNSRPILLGLVSKSWRYAVTSFFTRQKTPDTANNPLVVWEHGPSGSAQQLTPRVRLTQSVELNKELYDTLVAPVMAKRLSEQVTADAQHAHEMNNREAEEADAMYDCECCFTPCSFEQVSICDATRHYICFRCIRHTVTEALYGQGWARSIDLRKCTLRCIAPASDVGGECDGCIPVGLVRRALLEGDDGTKHCKLLDERTARDNLAKSQLPVIQCPFCLYGEVDAPDEMLFRKPWASAVRLLWWAQLPLFSLVAPIQTVCLVVLSLLVAGPAFVLYLFTTQQTVSKAFYQSQLRVTRARRGNKFKCLNDSCGRSSCVACRKPWKDIHVCYESERLNYRAFIEQAMADAVKRTCPNCNTSFVKASGCNKLTCVCGYKMCYVCRQEIGKEGYKHFCQHFRADARAACAECDRCDLYKSEDEAAAIAKARKRADREWREREGIIDARVIEEMRNEATSKMDDTLVAKCRGWARKVTVEKCLDVAVDVLME